MRINGQYYGINNELISMLIFKYQELTRKFLELFWIFINFNWEYFSPQHTSYGKLFCLSG
jgi:hypothetical protein